MSIYSDDGKVVLGPDEVGRIIRGELMATWPHADFAVTVSADVIHVAWSGAPLRRSVAQHVRRILYAFFSTGRIRYIVDRVTYEQRGGLPDALNEGEYREAERTEAARKWVLRSAVLDSALLLET